MDINESIISLSKKRTVFHSEADFQFALAWEIHLLFPSAKVRLEYPIETDLNQVEYIDILINYMGKYYPIELKYKTKEIDLKIENEFFYLKNQGWYDKNLYGFINDICRVENFAFSLADMDCGFVIWLTNDPRYWNKPKKFDAGYVPFSVYEGVKKSGVMSWGNENGPSGWQAYELELMEEYTIHWKQYSDLKIDNGMFKYVLLNISP